MPVMRLQRMLARAGIASRRKAEALISSGKVLVNGSQATLGQSVNTEKDSVEVEGRRVKLAATHDWLMLNKPAGVLTAASDARGRKTVFDILGNHAAGLTYVGRLDYLTEGLLLLTTDGEAVHQLTHPSSEVERVYVATVQGDGRAAASAMRAGVELDDGLVRIREVTATHLGRSRWELRVSIAEGRNREIRRLCAALDLMVDRLVRVEFGALRLGTLPTGSFRPLTRSEIQLLNAKPHSRG